MYIYFFEFDVCVGVTAASAVVTEERETQIRFLTHHRITPLPINVNNSRRRRSCVLYTHAVPIYEEKKQTKEYKSSIHCVIPTANLKNYFSPPSTFIVPIFASLQRRNLF